MMETLNTALMFFDLVWIPGVWYRNDWLFLIGCEAPGSSNHDRCTVVFSLSRPMDHIPKAFPFRRVASFPMGLDIRAH